MPCIGMQLRTLHQDPSQPLVYQELHHHQRSPMRAGSPSLGTQILNDTTQRTREKLTAHPRHDLVQNEQGSVLLTNRLHRRKVPLRGTHDTSGGTNNSLCDDLN